MIDTQVGLILIAVVTILLFGKCLDNMVICIAITITINLLGKKKSRESPFSIFHTEKQFEHY